MSSTSRSPDDKADPPEDAEKKKSPGRYSLADEGEVPPTRIDSTTRMPAVRPEAVSASSRASSSTSNALPKLPPPPKDKKRSPIGLPTRNQPPPVPSRAPTPPASTTASPATQTSQNEGKPEEARGLENAFSPAEAPTDSKKAGPPSSRRGAMPAGGPSSRPPRRLSSAPPVMTRRISSLRPPPPPQAAVGLHRAPGESIDPASESPLTPLMMLEGFDEGSIAFAFDALVSDGPTGEPGTHSFDLTPVRELFSELAANHMRHVRDFMIDVKWGEVTRDWIHICVPPVRTLRRAAEHLELAELGEALERLGAELDTANAIGGQMLDTNEKQRLLDTYGELVSILPQAFALDGDKTQREAVIVQALLLQVPDVRKVTIDKLHAAGLTSLTVLFEANANDIAHVAGIQHSLATRIVDRVQQYRNELKSSSPQDARAAEREKLAKLSASLKQHHAAYEEAQNGWGPEAKAKKRDHFRAREETWLEITVLLARFGEVDRLQGIEKVPFAQRIAQLADYLEEARDKYRAAEG
jgi:hypothetical protein